MFMQRTRLAAATGKLPEMEALIVERVKADQGRGRRVGLSRTLFSSDGVALIVTVLADDLAGIERIRQENLADPSFQALVGKMAPLLHEVPRTRILESLLTSPRTGTTVNSMAFVAPAPGREAQVTSRLEEFVRAGQAAGVTTGLWRRVFSSDGPMLAVVTRYADLAELDRVRRERTAATRELAAAIGEHLRAPVSQRLFELVVPVAR